VCLCQWTANTSRNVFHVRSYSTVHSRWLIMWGCLAEENAHSSLWCNLICESLVEFVQYIWWQGWSILAGHEGVWCLWLVSDGTCGHSEFWQKFERGTTYVRHVLSRRRRCILWSSGVRLSAIWCFSVLGTYLPTTYLPAYQNTLWQGWGMPYEQKYVRGVASVQYAGILNNSDLYLDAKYR